MSTSIQKALVQDRIDKICDQLGVESSEAFTRLVFSLLTGRSYTDLEPEDLVDGADDLQLDVVHIDDSSQQGQATVYVIQATTADSFGTNKLIQMGNGLDYLLAQPRERFTCLNNLSLVDRISEFRTLRTDLGSANVRVVAAFASLGTLSTTSDDFDRQATTIRDKYQVSPFELRVLGVAELADLMEARDPRRAPVNERIQVEYDRNRGSVLEHSIHGVRALACTVKGEEVARLVNTHPQIFDSNLRQYLGNRGTVNSAIKETCSSPESAGMFWFLNNGLTILCDSFEETLDPDGSYLDVTNMQIVNGCQTSATLAECARDGTLEPTTTVMVRVLRADSPELAEHVVITTNNQNRITSRNLKANDTTQAHLQRTLSEVCGIHYERKPNEFAHLPRTEQAKIISNEKIGQAVLAVVLRAPSDGRRRKYKIWAEEYARVFSTAHHPEMFLLAYRIMVAADKWKRARLAELPADDVRRRILANGVLHVARAATFEWRGGDDWTDRSALQRSLRQLDEDPDILDAHFSNALDTVRALIETDMGWRNDVATALKLTSFDEQLTRALYQRRAGVDIGVPATPAAPD